ncbi:MAG: YCF48-related protein [Candidatus Kapabacteria bacterium]|nr:YCF48-related protein [Candidatus Kapabacteria bacterium]
MNSHIPYSSIPQKRFLLLFLVLTLWGSTIDFGQMHHAFAQTSPIANVGRQDWLPVEVSAAPDGVPDYWLEAYFLPSNPRLGWIVGFYRRVLYTTDGGRTWTRTEIPGRPSYDRGDFRNHLEGVWFPDAVVGYATGPGGVFKSQDSGRTWRDITPLQLNGVESRTWGCYFTHRDTGYVMSGGCGDQQLFLRTTNGGNTWTVFSGPDNNSGLSDAIVYSSRGLGYAVSSGQIFRTLNGGLSWDVFARTFTPTSRIQRVWQEDLSISNRTFLVPYSGTECTGGGPGGGMRISRDMAQTWSDFATGQQMFGTYLLNDSTGWAVGLNAAAYYTNNYGRTWELRNCGIPPNADLDDLWFVNDTLGFVVGEGVYRFVPPSERELKIRPIPPTPFFCQGDSVVLTVSGGFRDYRWSNGATTSTVVVRQSGTYRVTATVFNCVSLSDSIQITFFPRPEARVSLSAPPRACEGTTIRLTSDIQLPNFRYEWSDGQRVVSTSTTLDVTRSGRYTLAVRNESGCTATSTTTITIFPRPNTTITSLRLLRFCIGDSSLLQAPAGFRQYRWYDVARSQMTVGTAQQFVTRVSGVYQAELTDNNGCIWTSNTVSVTALDFSKQLFVLSTTGEFRFDTLGINQATCASVILRNADSLRTVTLRSIPVARNVEFSLALSQFPFVLPPNTTRTLTVCFAPRELGTRRDTIFVEDSCGVVGVPLVGESVPNAYIADSRCSTRVILRSVGSGLKRVAAVLRTAEPVPNPASDEVSLMIEQLLDNDNLGTTLSAQTTTRCVLKDVLGNTLAEGTYTPQDRFQEGLLTYQRGTFVLPVQHISTGAYMLMVQSEQGMAALPVIIRR